MKKIYNKFIAAGLAVTAMTGFSACGDGFLEEEMISTITQDYLATEQGLNQLVVSSYNAMRVRYGYTEGPYMFEVGHDAGVLQNTSVNNFSTSVWSSTGTIASQTNSFMGIQSKQQSGFNINCFPVIDNCNKAITAIRTGAALGKYASDPEFAAQRLSEVLFNRDYLFYSMNTLLGDIPVSTVSITSIPANFNYPRVPSADLWTMMISDLRYAVEHLPETYSSGEFGRITKYAAAHLLSKLYLQRAQGAQYGTSEYGRNADGTIDTSNPKSYLGMLYKGTGTADLDSCIYYSSMVINSGKYELEPNFADIFKCGINDYSNEGSKEIILSGVWADGADSYRYGNRSPQFYNGAYVNAKYGIPTYCWEYPTKNNTTFVCNDWGFDVFTDKINDSRYQGSFHLEFKTALMGGTNSTKAPNLDYYAYNNANNATYEWTEEQAAYFNEHILPTYNRKSWGGRQAVAGEHKMGTGDLAFAMLENTRETAIDVEEADAQPFVLYARWMKKDGKYYYRPEIVASGNGYSFVNSEGVSTNFYGLEKTYRTGQPFSRKWDDPNRGSYNSVYGTRDVPVMRFAEAYLVRAEAYGRKGNYDLAVADINKVRERAAFKIGDTRAEVLARLYPGHEELSTTAQSYPYTVDVNSYNAIKVDQTYWDGSSEKSKLEDYPSSAASTLDRFVHFIANEYCREFSQECGPYYEYVHHAGIQAERIQWHHQMGSSSSTHSDWGGAADNVNGKDGQTGENKGGFQPGFTLKPFPLTQYLDKLTDENGVQLSEEQKKAYQNYGY